MEATDLTPEERTAKIRREQAELNALKKKLSEEQGLVARSSDPDPFASEAGSRKQVRLTNKLENIIVPRIDFKNTSLDDAVEYLTQMARELGS